MNYRKIFIIGAGFDRSIFENTIPLNDGLLNILAKQFEGTAAGVTGCLKHFMKKYGTDQIEEFLTFLDMEVTRAVRERNPWVDEFNIIQFRQDFNVLIADYFSSFRFTKDIVEKQPWLEQLINQVLSNDDAIVNLNYTTVLEGAMDYFQKWSPFGGYARVNEPPFDSASHKHNKDLLNIHIYKIHGSENFLEAEYIDRPNSSYIGFRITPEIYPFSCAYSFLGVALPKNTYVIAPSFVKVPHVQMGYMMTDLLKESPLFNYLIIVGCSLRREDNFLWLLVSSFLDKDYKKKKIIICDPYADLIKGKIISYYGGLINDYLMENIICINETCARSIERLKNNLS